MVEEAIAFYRGDREPPFGSAKCLVADRSGTSAILLAHGGCFQVIESNCSSGFGHAAAILERMIPQLALVVLE